MPFAKNHNCFYSQDRHGELPTRQPYPPPPRPYLECGKYRVPCLWLLTLHLQDGGAGKFTHWPHTQVSLL